MQVTLDQARALDAFAREGTLQGAGKRLHKAHTAVLYALKQLETQSGLVLLDRSGYRTRLTEAGQGVLVHCRRLLAAEAELADACRSLRSGWEPALRLVFDGVHPIAPLLQVVRLLRAEGAPTRLQVDMEHLDGVERRFVETDAHLMIAVLPVNAEGLVPVSLPAIRAKLVAHRNHPLAKVKGRLTRERLAEHVLLTVRGSDPRLGLETGPLDRQSTVALSDFHAKRAAIVDGLGFGWLPLWLAKKDLAARRLVVLPLEDGDTHVFEPRLWRRSGARGNAAERVVASLSGR